MRLLDDRGKKGGKYKLSLRCEDFTYLLRSQISLPRNSTSRMPMKHKSTGGKAAKVQ